jgi:Ca2+-binding EF-hand superfamily protein
MPSRSCDNLRHFIAQLAKLCDNWPLFHDLWREEPVSDEQYSVRNNPMKKIAIISASAALVVAGVAIAQPGGMRGDANGDGNLTRDEVNAQIDARFARADANGDGAIDASERAAAREQMRARWSERRGRHGRHGRHGNRMERMDSNGDGVITREEVTERALARFDRFDANGDGQITEVERDQAREQRRERRAQRRANRPNPDANGDGLITRAEMGAMAFERFDRADANGDGVVTREERRAAREAHRAARQGG